MSSGGSTSRHIIEVMYQVTGLDKAGTAAASFNKNITQGQTTLDKFGSSATKASQSTKQYETTLNSTGQAVNRSSTGIKTYSGSLTSLGSANSAAAKSTDMFTGSLGQFSTANKATIGGLTETNTVTKGLTPTMGALGNEGTKTRSKMQQLTDVFQGNKGLIFSTTMLSSGIVEAIGMYQGWQDASEKLAAAKEKEADLLARGMEGTREYGDAVNDVADAQRGYNFITRFTIQSFADLIPMTLMLTSSLIGMVGDVGGLTAAKTKLAAAGSKLVGVFKTMGSALMTFTTRHPLLAMLTIAAAAVLALIKNFMGFRDAVNAVGVALGNAIAPLKGALEYVGLQGNAALDTADSFLTYGDKAFAASSDVEKQVLKTGDATVTSFNDQIELMGKLGDEAGEMAFSMGAHLKKQEQDEQARTEKYEQFVEAMTSGNDDIMQSLGLTTQEFEDFSATFQKEVEAMDETWNTAVEGIQENWAAVTDGFAESTDSTIGEIIKLEDKITELTAQQWELDDEKALEKNRAEIAKNEAKINELRGTTDGALGDMGAMYDIFGNAVQTNVGQKITPAMEQAGRDFIALGKAGTDGLNAIRNGILAQDFQGAISSLSMALDAVPEKYQGNFAKIDSIMGNSQLTQRQKIDMIITQFGSLEDAFKPLIVGAYELDRTNALLATSLDEVAVAARQNMHDMGDAKGAWDQFLSSLTPAQRELPMIKDLIAEINAGAITHAEALQKAEAAGRSWSTLLKKDVAMSIKDVAKTMIDMGDGTTKMVGNVNGLMVDLGRVSNTELGKVSNNLGTVDSSMAKTGQAAQQSIANEATAAVGVFGKDGQFHFATVVEGANGVIDVFKAVDIYADRYVAKGAGGKVATLGPTMTNTGAKVKSETAAWGVDFEGFATSVTDAFNTIVNVLNTPIDLGAAAAALVTSLNDAITKEFPKLVTQGGEMVTQIGKGIMDFAVAMVPAAEATINHFATGTMKKYQELVKIGSAIVDQVGKGVIQFASLIENSAEGVINYLVTGFQKRYQQIVQQGGALVDQVGKGITQFAKTIATSAEAIVNNVVTGIQKGYQQLLQQGSALVDQVGKGITQFASTIGPSAQALVNNFVTGIQKVASTVLEAGKGLVTQIGLGIESLFPAMKTEGNDTVTQFRDGAVTTMKLLLDVGKGFIANIKTGIDSASKIINTAGKTIGTWLDAGAKSFGFAKIGNYVIGEVVRGITAWASKIKEGLVGAFETAKKAVESLFTGWDPLKAVGGVLEEIKKALFGGGLQDISAEKGEGMNFMPYIDTKLYDAALAKMKTSASQQQQQLIQCLHLCKHQSQVLLRN